MALSFPLIRHRQGRRAVHIPTILSRKINNYGANKLISGLAESNKDRAGKWEESTVDEAFTIYNQIEQDRNDFVINSMLKLCLYSNYPFKIKQFWSDIINVLETNEFNSLSYPLLIKCCIKSPNITIEDSIIMLKWMERYDYKLRIHYSLIIKLITKCDGKHSNIKYIDSLLQNGHLSPNQVEHELFIKSVLIEKYHDHLDDALSTFHSVKDCDKDIVLITNMMKVLLHNNRHHDALSLYHQYSALNDNVSGLLALRACSKLLLFNEGRQIHESMDTSNTLNISDSDAIKTKMALIHFYGESGDIDVALDLYRTMEFQNEQCTNAILEALIRNGRNHDAVELYQKDGGSPVYMYRMMKILVDNDSENTANDALDLYERFKSTLKDRKVHSLALKCCVITKCYEFGEEIISEHFRSDLHDLDVVDSMALISFYGSYDIDAAERIFDAIGDDQQTVESVSCWMTALIDSDRGRDALTVYDRFSTLRDEVTDLLAMKATINCGDFERGKVIESRVCANGMDRVPISFKNMLIDFYGHFDDIESAQNVFASIPDSDKNIVTVGSMLSAYSRCKMYNHCKDLFENMSQFNETLKPNVICYRIMFSACAEGTIFHFGQELHRKLRQNVFGKILRDRSVQIHLIKMYGKMGMMEVCDGIFEEIKKYQEEEWRNEIAIWNVMINVYGHNGDMDRAEMICRQMIDESNVMPDDKTYIQLLSGCGHCGEMERAQRIWREISNPEIKYDSFVVTALIDCFARNGALNEGHRVLMEYEGQRAKEHPNDKAMWMALLNGCRKCGDIDFARTLFDAMCERSFEQETVADATILMASICTEDQNAYQKL